MLAQGKLSDKEHVVRIERMLEQETDLTRNQILNLVSGKADRLATLKDVWEGAVEGDEMYIISPLALEYGLEPLIEIYDTHRNDDNGNVVVELETSRRSMRPDAHVVIHNPEWGPRKRCLPIRVTPQAPIKPENLVYHARSHMRGEIVVCDYMARGEKLFVVGWRPDARHSNINHIISAHNHEESAIKRANWAAKSFIPPQRVKSRKIRDYQQSLVYNWENRILKEDVDFESLEEGEQFLQSIYRGLPYDAPDLSIAGRKLKNYSFFNVLNGIVVLDTMLSRNTIIHEAAHHLVYEMKVKKEASHGPIFCGVLLGLYNEHCGVDVEEAERLAVEMGVDISNNAYATMKEKGGHAPSFSL